MAAKTRTVMPGVTMRVSDVGFKSVRFSCMVNRKRFTCTCDLPADLLVDPKSGRATSILLIEYRKWVAGCVDKSGIRTDAERHVPTVGELIRAYEEIAWKRHADPDFRRPGERAIETAVKNYGYCVAASGLDDSQPYTELCNVDMARKLFKRFRDEQGCKGLTAKSYVVALQSVTSNWACLEYHDRGWDVKQTKLPNFGITSVAERYERLSDEMVKRIDAWYASLEEGPELLAATLIYNLAIRPTDCGKLTKENFPVSEGKYWVKYLPTKTQYSSGRRVEIEIPEALWEEIRALGGRRFEEGKPLLRSRRTAFDGVNRSMRLACGMDEEKWPKAAYELRKLCLDTVVRTQGVEMAVKLSGDRRETIEYYYVDPFKSDEMLRVKPLERRERER